MIILEQPYTSPELIQFLINSQTPVLDNAAARQIPEHHQFHLLQDEEFTRKLNAGARLYTTSENALTWVHTHATDTTLLNSIDLMKNKFRLRKSLQTLHPDYYFQELYLEEMKTLDPATLPLPVVLKPVVGFFSVGVYVITEPNDWHAALGDIHTRQEAWRQEYSPAVVGNDYFILEEYIVGDEYAVDAYYDAAGKAVIVNILRHEFSSQKDVSDRLYYTSPEIIREHLEAFTTYLNRVGSILGSRNFPLHLELRLTHKGIIPIEFNPLRFAGWCTTDVAWFAYGLRTYEYYLNNTRPHWDTLLQGREGNIYSMVILDKPRLLASSTRLNFSAVRKVFTQVLSERRLDDKDFPVFGFLFTCTPAHRREELQYIMHSDLTEFMQSDQARGGTAGGALAKTEDKPYG